MNVTTQVLLRASRLTAGSGSSTPLLLDTVINAYAAWGMQKLRTAYSGACLRGRRDSDNAEADFGFVGNALDTASIASFGGAGSVYVTKWYDQSGNARDLAQATTTIQPIIFESGVQCVLNGKPCMKFVAASAHRLAAATAADWKILHDGTVVSIAIVNQANDTAVSKTFLSTHAGGSNTSVGFRLSRNASEVLSIITGNGSATIVNYAPTPGSASQRVTFILHDPGNATAASRATAWGNGSLLTGSNAAAGSPSASDPGGALSVGANNGGSAPYDGTGQGLILWASDKTANRTTIESALNTFYGVY